MADPTIQSSVPAQASYVRPQDQVCTPAPADPTIDENAGVCRMPQDQFTPSSAEHALFYGPRDFARKQPDCSSPTPEPAADIPQYTDDPTLDHNARTCDPHLSEQPLVKNSCNWDSQRILANLGQLDTTGRADHQGERCGAASLVGSAVMQGPDATARFTERLATHVTDPHQQQELNDIRDRIHNGSATNGDLNRVQELAYNRYNTDGQWGLTTNELSQMHRDLSADARFDANGASTTAGGQRDTVHQGEVEEQPGRTTERMGALHKGESFTMFVDTDRPNNGVNHFVQVGRDANGRAYVYDPLARDNQPNVIYQDRNPKAFGHYVDGSMGDASTTTVPGRVNVVAGGTVSQ